MALPAMVALVSAFPGVGDGFCGFTVVADLKADVGEGVVVIEIAAFVACDEFDEDFFVVPRLCGDIGIAFAVSAEVRIGVIFFGAVAVAVVVDDDIDDGLRVVFSALNVEIDFCSDLMF